MCGRYALTNPQRVRDKLGVVREFFEYGERDHRFDQPRYNISPSQVVLAVATIDGQRTSMPMRWGLRPDGTWFNARDDKATSTYKTRIARRRCVVPFDAFYEWRQVGKRKDKYAIAPPGDGPHAFAAVYDESPAGRSVAVFTTEPNDLCRWIHNVKERMPVILDEAGIDRWLNADETDPAKLIDLLKPSPDGGTQAWPVDRTSGESPGAIEPVGAAITAPPVEPPKETQGELW